MKTSVLIIALALLLEVSNTSFAYNMKTVNGTDIWHAIVIKYGPGYSPDRCSVGPGQNSLYFSNGSGACKPYGAGICYRVYHVLPNGSEVEIPNSAGKTASACCDSTLSISIDGKMSFDCGDLVSTALRDISKGISDAANTLGGYADQLRQAPRQLSAGADKIGTIPKALDETAQKIEASSNEIQKLLATIADKKAGLTKQLASYKSIKQVKELQTNIMNGLDSLSSALCKLSHACNKPEFCPTGDECRIHIISKELPLNKTLGVIHPYVDLAPEIAQIQSKFPDSMFMYYVNMPATTGFRLATSPFFIFENRTTCKTGICQCSSDGTCEKAISPLDDTEKSSSQNPFFRSSQNPFISASRNPFMPNEEQDIEKLQGTKLLRYLGLNQLADQLIKETKNPDPNFCVGHICRLARSFKEQSAAITQAVKTMRAQVNDLQTKAIQSAETLEAFSRFLRGL